MREFGLAVVEFDLHLDQADQLDPMRLLRFSRVIAPACALTAALHEARAAFMAVLDGYSLADLVKDRKAGLRQLLESLGTSTPAATA